MSDAAARLAEVFRNFCGDDLHGLWVFDHHGYEHPYIREDVSDALECLDISQLIDNKRLGYVTRDIYETLYYTDYGYTVRGFDSFEQFRIFVGNRPTGILAGFDRGAGHNFAALHGHVCTLSDKSGGADLLSDPTARDRLPWGRAGRTHGLT